MQHLRMFILLIIPVALLVSGCTTLPDVSPFATSTAGLAAAAGTQYNSVASDIASLKPVKMKGETEEAFQLRKEQIESTQMIFEETDKNLNALFSAMTTYSEKLASLAAAGETGPEAAQSILDSVQGFTELAGIAGPPLGGAADSITKGFKAIADEFTKMQAKKSLKEAVAAAEPGVNLVVEQFEVIYGKAIRLASDGIRNYKLAKAQKAAGPSVIGFYDTVTEKYNAYYQFLNDIVKRSDSNAPSSAWRGFCRNSTGPCKAKEELEAVGLVEARMAAIRPIVETFKTSKMNIEAIHKHRLTTSGAVIQAVQAWGLEHQKLRRSLEDGTSLSAFNLKATLIELNNLLGKQPPTIEPD